MLNCDFCGDDIIVGEYSIVLLNRRICKNCYIELRASMQSANSESLERAG